MRDLINKFPNGQKLYNTNAIFNSIVNSIYKGLDIYEAVSIFSEINETQQQVIKDLLEKMPMQPIMFKEE